MQTKCGKCRRLNNDRQAAYFVERQVLVLDDLNYVAESGGVVYGWWGPSCAGCLRWVQETPELIWLEAIPLSDVAVISKERGQHEYHPDWSRAAVRVGSRVPSEAMRKLLAACDPAHSLVTPRETAGTALAIKRRGRTATPVLPRSSIQRR